MKKLLVLFFILSVNSLFAVWDLTFRSDITPMEVEMRIVTIPFEGYNRVESGNLNNRLYEIYNGGIHRRLCGSEVIDSQIVFQKDTIQGGHIMTLASCFSEASCYHFKRWGFAKYLITFRPINDTSKTIRFYLNTLDSKLGIDTNGGDGYHADWGLEYYENNGNPFIVFDANHNVKTDTIKFNQQFKEIKMWEFMLGRNSPWAKEFKVRTTPFGISRKYSGSLFRELAIGTKIVLDTVFRNKDAVNFVDKDGFNTQNDIYYDNPNLPFYRAGDMYMTPGIAVLDPSEFIYKTLKIIANAGDTIVLKRNKVLWVFGSGPDLGDTLVLRAGSTVIRENNSEIMMHRGGVVIDSSATQMWSPLSCMRVFENSSLKLIGNDKIINNGGFIVIDSNANFQIGENSTVTFDGSGSFLLLKMGAKITMGQNSKLVFKNGARINAKNVTFNTSNNNLWEGIVLESPGSEDTIINCTFNNAKNGVKISYPAISHFSSAITNNTFNIPASGYGLVGLNIIDGLFTGNTFNGGYVQMYIRNDYIPSEEEAAANFYVEENVKIMNNTFNGGKASVIVAGYLNQQTRVYIYGNNFATYNNSSPEYYNVILRKADGSIKNNFFNNQNVEKNIFLSQGLVQIYGNVMKAKYNNIYAGYKGFPILAPSVSGETSLLYEGGNNTLETYVNNSDFKGNIFSDALDQRFFTNYGINSFITNSSGYHFYGYYGTNSSVYSSFQNCFSPSPPQSYILNYSGFPPMTVDWTPNMNCNNGLENVTGSQINDKGGDVNDTVPVTSIYSQTVPADERLYGRMCDFYNNYYYLDDITTGKNLIDSFPSSDYLYLALDNMLYGYAALDTFFNQGDRNVLWGDFKLYLENKIASKNYDDKFSDAMYEYSLYCLTNMDQTEQVLEGYEMIAMYHPNPNTRLLATWDAEELENMLAGNAGGKIEKESIKKLNLSKTEINRIKELNHISIITTASDLKKLEQITEYENQKPVKEIVKEIYKKETKNNEKAVSKKSDRKIGKLPQKSDYAKIETMKNRIKTSGKDEKINLQAEHLMLIGGSASTETDVIGNLIPEKYSLSQNYPNPFNPATTIKYSLPKAGFVSIKIYDVVGRLVKELVSEYKEIGSYNITFDGSQFASGVYFYRMETNSFVDTKRMVLVK